jgi:predicted molibdopterin-dependent oxidoreductase YjgC
MQTNNVDHCARLCHAPSVTAMMAALGSGATSNSYVDYEEAGCILVAGSDPTTNHPVIAARMKKAIVEKGAKLIVMNPRRIDMCDVADVWLRPKPGTDVALCNSMAKVVLDEGLADRDFIDNRTEGFDEWLHVVDGYTPERVEELTGIAAADIIEAARIYARPPFSGSCLAWGMGITQHTQGTANAHSLVNLALVSGQIGKPGSGVSPLRGQNNVQGCGDAGCLPNLFPGYQALNDATISKFGAAWSDQPLPSERGLMLTQMVDQMLTGGIKAVYIVGENPLLSEPDLHHAEKAFKSLEFLVVQDIFLHETAQLADVVLPAASFAERDGTFSNSERRVSASERLSRRPARADQIGRSSPSSVGASASASTWAWNTSSTTPILRRSGTRWRAWSRSSPGSRTTAWTPRAASSGPAPTETIPAPGSSTKRASQEDLGPGSFPSSRAHGPRSYLRSATPCS